jgi:hypothetical protein
MSNVQSEGKEDLEQIVETPGQTEPVIPQKLSKIAPNVE